MTQNIVCVHVQLCAGSVSVLGQGESEMNVKSTVKEKRRVWVGSVFKGRARTDVEQFS